MAATMSTETQAMTSVTPSYRRNGKLFSCRRGKLKCDHNTPVCGRCARRNKPEQCIFHPAPLTKTRSSPDNQRRSLPASISGTATKRQKNGLVSPSSSTSAGAPLRDTATFKAANGSSLGQLSSVHSPGLATLDLTTVTGSDRRESASVSYTSPESSMSFKASTGFLGPTSYNAVFAENAGSLGVIAEPEESEDPSRLPPVSSERIQQGAEVLALLRDMPMYEKITQRWFELCDGIVIMQPAFRIWVDDLWAEFGDLLNEGNHDQMRSLSELVWRNTRKPMKTHGQMTALQWAKSASGRNMRWEVVGCILSLVGLIAVNLSNWDSVFDSIREKFIDRATFAERMRKASEYVLCYCYECEVLNDIYVTFIYEELVLVECIKGDAHHAAWQRCGEVCDTIVAMGLHQGNYVNSETPFFLAQLRKKIFVSAYGHDKLVATFLGRPPRLSHRYCRMEVPLDLSDEQLFLEGAELDAAIAQLDSKGWNTTGNVNRTTWRRAWFEYCRIREDILEIALGSGEEDISHQVEQIRSRLGRLHSVNPEFMKLTPEQVLGSSESHLKFAASWKQSEQAMRQVNAIFTVMIQVGIIHTEWLLQRALINRKRADPKDLIPISRRMLAITLLTYAKRDYFRDFQGDIGYTLAMHGLPAAGVLAIELLKQEQTRIYTPDILPRSETIQEISVLISALGSIEPGEGNFAICNQGRKALKRIIDQILSPTPLPILGSADPPALDDMDLFFPTGNDADFLQWLENVEWDRGNYMMPSASQEAP